MKDNQSFYFWLIFFLFFINLKMSSQDKYFTKSGYVSFYSHTLVEDIQADNNQVLSIVDVKTGEIVIKILMRSFHFKKALMQEHFNENYIESYKYPKAVFKGKIYNFDEIDEIPETVVRGTLTIHGATRNIEIKTKIKKEKDLLLLEGVFHIKVADYNIKIPAVVSKNISKTIQVTFKLKHKPYKK
jgi:polyisoprenoid-binding protein YceI